MQSCISAFDPFASWSGVRSCDEPVPIAFHNGMLPPLVDKNRDASVWTRSKKLRAIDRVDALALWAGERQVLRLLVKRGKGPAHRCVLSHEHIARLLHRSGIMRGEHGTVYSVQHVRVCLRRLEAVGLVRWVRLLRGDRFPSRDMKVDGAGDVVQAGACVFEVNMAALLGEGPVWPARERRPGTGGRPRRSALPLEESAQAEELAAAVEAFRELPAPDAPPAPASSPAPVGVIVHDPDGVIMGDQCSVVSASQKRSHAPERSAASGLALSGSRTTADAGSRHAAEAPRTAPARAVHAASEDERASRGKSRAVEPPHTAPHAATAPRTSSAPPTESARRGREQNESHLDERPATPDEQRRAMTQIWLQPWNTTARPRGSS